MRNKHIFKAFSGSRAQRKKTYEKKSVYTENAFISKHVQTSYYKVFPTDVEKNHRIVPWPGQTKPDRVGLVHHRYCLQDKKNIFFIKLYQKSLVAETSSCLIFRMLVWKKALGSWLALSCLQD